MITKMAGAKRSHDLRRQEAANLICDPADPRDRELALRHLYGWSDQP